MSNQAGAKVLTIDRDRYRYKMKDLADATGLDRQGIHFYIQQGLLPPGHKTGRNMAWYTEAHLERLRIIKKLQHERFLPLKAIKALLEGREEAFAPEQQQFLQNVRENIDESLSTRGPAQRVPVADLLMRADVDRDDLADAEALGFASIVNVDGEASISVDEAWMFDSISELRQLGFSKERGFTVADVSFYHEAMSQLFRKEIGLLSSRLAHLPPEEGARMIERAMPIINQILSRLHTQLVREFFGNSI
jgi:DNA-binding transcriptional MerR regulator